MSKRESLKERERENLCVRERESEIERDREREDGERLRASYLS